MRHRARSGAVGRNSSHRLAMYRNMVTSLLDHERIETTDAKAKAVRRLADRMITLGKRGDLHARRRALRVIRSREVAAKVFDDLAERYRNRQGGYTRVLKVRYRTGDAAAMSVVELVDSPLRTVVPEVAKKARGKAKAEAKQASAAKKSAAAEKKATRKKATEADEAKTKSSKKKATKKKAAAKPAAKKTTKKAAAKKTSKKK